MPNDSSFSASVSSCSLSDSAAAAIRPDLTLPQTFEPGPYEVIIGRGKKVYYHAGNVQLRAMVQSQIQEYAAAPNRAAKTVIIANIYKTLRAQGGVGFVKRHAPLKCYVRVEDTMAKTAIAQYFRDALAVGYKSSKQYKQKLRDEEKNTIKTSDKSTTKNISKSQSQSSFQDEAAVPSKTVSRTVFVTEPPPAAAGASPAPGPASAAADLLLEDSLPPLEISFSSPLPSQAPAAVNDRYTNVMKALNEASDLIDDDDYLLWPELQSDFPTSNLAAPEANKPRLLFEEDYARQDEHPGYLRQQQHQQHQQTLFSSLYQAFGSNVDISSNPYEPTPIVEKKHVFSSEEKKACMTLPTCFDVMTKDLNGSASSSSSLFLFDSHFVGGIAEPVLTSVSRATAA